jgi:D-alanyl-D-alanine carboxypeptidase
MRLLAVLALGACLGCSRGAEPPLEAAPPAASPSPDWSALAAEVDRLAQAAVADGPVAGLSIAVARNGNTILARGYGQADREAALAATPETSYPVASITKQFTAAAVLQLAERGRLSLDADVRSILPEATGPVGGVRLRQLLNHTSSLRKPGPAPRTVALRALRRWRIGAAGQEWDYSNLNFSVLGLVVERASGRPYADYVREELAGPLGLAGTGYCEDGRALPGRSRDYELRGRLPVVSDYWTQARFFASGGLCSTVLDLLAWQRALDEGRVLSAASLSAMRAATPIPGGLEVEYGFGTRLGRLDGHPKLGHTGGGRSNKAVLARYPEDDLTIAVLLNTETTGARVVATDLEAAVAQAALGLPATPVSAVPMAEADLQRYAGTYRDGPRLVRLAAGADGLRLRLVGSRAAAAPLRAQGGDAFADAEEPSVVLRFVMDGTRARAYARYHNGWFVGLGARTADVPDPPARPRARRPRKATRP